MSTRGSIGIAPTLAKELHRVAQAPELGLEQSRAAVERAALIEKRVELADEPAVRQLLGRQDGAEHGLVRRERRSPRPGGFDGSERCRDPEWGSLLTGDGVRNRLRGHEPELDQYLAERPPAAVLLGDRVIELLGSEKALVDHDRAELAPDARVHFHDSRIGGFAGSLELMVAPSRQDERSEADNGSEDEQSGEDE
jgi:hypothetical protein